MAEPIHINLLANENCWLLLPDVIKQGTGTGGDRFIKTTPPKPNVCFEYKGEIYCFTIFPDIIKKEKKKFIKVKFFSLEGYYND